MRTVDPFSVGCLVGSDSSCYFEISNLLDGQLVQSQALGFFDLFDVGIMDDDLHHPKTERSDLSLDNFQPFRLGLHRNGFALNGTHLDISVI